MNIRSELSGHRPIRFDQKDVPDDIPPLPRTVLLLHHGKVIASCTNDPHAVSYDGLSLPPAERCTADTHFFDCEYKRHVVLFCNLLKNDATWQLAVVPSSPAPAVKRVLHHAFSDRVCMLSGTYPGSLRASDHPIFVSLLQLLNHAERMLFHTMPTVRIGTWKELSDILIPRMAAVNSFLGIPLRTREIPLQGLPMPLIGSVSIGPTIAMLLCCAMGISSVFSTDEIGAAVEEMDHQLLLPQIVLPQPVSMSAPEKHPAFLACTRIAAMHGAFFDVRRGEDGVHIRFCPVCPDRADLYALRSMPRLQYDGENA